VNSLRWDSFAGGVKDDAGGGSNQTTVDSILYTLTTGTLNNGGTLNSTQQWTLSWADTNGATAPNLPISVDFALLWNGGNQDVFYLLNDVVLPISPSFGTGLIDIKVTNPPGNSDIGTSHLDVFVSNATATHTTPGGISPVPEPATLSLLGAAMLGGLFSYRRRQRHG
jgi:hypothetical protein